MAVNKVEINGEVKLDLTQDTVTPQTLLKGATAHSAAGDKIDGAVVVAPASNTTPKAPGTASAGSESAYARGDHVHPKQAVTKSDVGLGNVDNVKQYSATNPPPYPVTSVNGATGEVKSTFYVTVTQGGGDNATADKTAEEVYAAHAAGYAVYAIAKFPALSPLPFMLPLVSAMSIGGNIGLGFSTLGSTSPTEVPQYPTVLYTGMEWKAWIGMLMRDPLNIQIGSTVTSYDGSYTVNVEIPEGVPSVTTADNGKFLRVVNGAWAAVEIANANGGSF